MKPILATALPALFLGAAPAFADTPDCFPLCAPAAEPAPLNACEARAVREIARVHRDLKPVRELYGIVTNPTGFALKQVNDHIVHIPPWVGIAMDPRGYVRNKVIDAARREIKKSVGAGNDCLDELAAAEAA